MNPSPSTLLSILGKLAAPQVWECDPRTGMPELLEDNGTLFSTINYNTDPVTRTTWQNLFTLLIKQTREELGLFQSDYQDMAILREAIRAFGKIKSNAEEEQAISDILELLLKQGEI